MQKKSKPYQKKVQALNIHYPCSLQFLIEDLCVLFRVKRGLGMIICIL